VLLTSTVAAEDYLITPNGHKYLGNRSGEKFVTCNHTVLDVGENTVKPAKGEKCDKSEGPKAYGNIDKEGARKKEEYYMRK
jgi:hypothetical protein